MSKDDRIGVLFVCMGNICRSPLAEAIFLNKINERELAGRFRVDSAGTGGWHVGESPDPRTAAIAKKKKVKLVSVARKVSSMDFDHYDYIVCMDQENVESVLSAGAKKKKVHLLLDFDKSSHLAEVPDPYYGGDDSFLTVYELLDSACDALIEHLISENGT